jgi:hypothetical protein
VRHGSRRADVDGASHEPGATNGACPGTMGWSRKRRRSRLFGHVPAALSGDTVALARLALRDLDVIKDRIGLDGIRWSGVELGRVERA